MSISFKLIIITAILHLSCKSNDQSEKSYREEIPSAGVMTPEGLSHFMVCDIDEVEFKIVMDNDDTLYLDTDNSKFITPEGFNVGMSFQDIPNELRQKMMKINGWGYYIPLKSKWNLAFCEGSSCTDEKPKSESKIKWIFKRK